MSAKPPPYTPLPSDAPPAYTPQPPEYTATPTVLHQQTTNSLVVTQGATTSRIHISIHPRASDNLILTVAMMVICGVMLNISAFICLIPALAYSLMASEANTRGDYDDARKKGQVSLWLNLTAMISFIALMIIGILLGLILATLSA